MQKIYILLALIAAISALDIDYFILTQNNTGPQFRSRPVLQCYPAHLTNYPRCFVASGANFSTSNTIGNFFNDVWEMAIDIDSRTVSWHKLGGVAPSEASGAFHQFWKYNLTAIAMVAGLNGFTPVGFPVCQSNNIVVYDFVNQAYQLITPINSYIWTNFTAGACGVYESNVYCFGGFNCTNFTDIPRMWTRYNMKTNTLTLLNSTGLSNVPARHHSSVICIHEEGRCIIGSGDLFAGGTLDQWLSYDIASDTITILNTTNTPQNTQYISIDSAQVWKVYTNNTYAVVNDKKKMLLIGGDNASGISGTSNTIRYLGQFNRNNLKFKKFDSTGLYTIKQEYLKNIPKVRHNDNDDDNETCFHWIEFGGFEENASTPLTYPNKVVLYESCKDD